MRILVTGAAGFVGLHIAHQLAALGETVIACDRDSPDVSATTFVADVRDRLCFCRGDVRDRNAMIGLVKRERIDRILHAAAVTPDDEHADPATVMDVNFGGTLNVLEAARYAQVERVVLVSSTAVYGSPQGRELPIHEDQHLTIASTYAIAKQASELLAARYAALYGLSAVVGRLGSAYGPLERPTSARRRMSHIMLLAQAALQRQEVTIAGADFPRDICHIDDAADAFARLLLAPQLRWPVYNVSAGEAPSLRLIADTLTTIVPDFTWRASDDPTTADLVVAPGSARGPLDLTRLHADTGFVPQYPFPQGLRRYLDWLQASSHGFHL